jgi:peroxiredoxin
MPKVELDSVAPNFTLKDFRGREVQLANLRGVKNVVLVFNRGFM